MAVITKEQLLEFAYTNWKTASPEFKNLWNNVNGLINWRTLTTLYFQGNIVGSEFLTYNAGKMYIAIDIKAGDISSALGYVIFYDINNVSNFLITTCAPYWNATAAAVAYLVRSVETKNIFFSRITYNAYTQLIFNGYRLNV